MKAASEGFGARIEREIRAIPRQAGLTARDLIEGAAETAGVITNPVTYLAQEATGQPMMTAGNLGAWAADKLGLPSPETPQERIINTGAKMMVPIGGQAALANKAAGAATGVGKGIAETLAAAPGAQLAGAAGGGTASQYATETGGGPGAQFAAGLVGGFGGAAGAGLMTAGARALSGLAGNVLKSVKGTQADISQINSQLNSILKQNGYKIGDVTGKVRLDLINEIKRANDAGTGVDEEALRRIADYGVVGATPRRGNVTLDPVQLTAEKNLAKFGANSNDPALQAMARATRENDIRLTQNLNEMGADKAIQPRDAGATLQSQLKSVDIPRKAAVDAAYEGVRNAQGRYANLDVPAFSNMANDALDQSMLGSALPSQAKGLLNDVSSGKIPLNVNTMAQLDKRLSGIRRDAFSSGTGKVRLRFRKYARRYGQRLSNQRPDSRQLSSIMIARQLAAKRFSLIENNPAMRMP